MNRPSPGDLAATLPPEVREQHQVGLARLDAALEGGDYGTAGAELEELRTGLGDSRSVQELAWSLAPDAYWRQATWRRLVAIGAGAAVPARRPARPKADDDRAPARQGDGRRVPDRDRHPGRERPRRVSRRRGEGLARPRLARDGGHRAGPRAPRDRTRHQSDLELG